MTSEAQLHEITPVPDTLEISPGEIETQDVPDTVSFFENAIRRGFRMCVTSMIEFAVLCAEAKAILPAEEMQRLLGRLRFQEVNFCKWAKIRTDRRLDKISDELPPNFSIVYEVTTLNDEELEAARNDGFIRPDVQRAEIISWKKSYRGKGSDKRRGKKRKLPDGDRKASASSGDGHMTGDSSPTDPDVAFDRLTAAWDESPAFRDAWANAPSEACNWT